MLRVGAVVSPDVLATETDRVTVEMLPEESVARAVRACVPGAEPDADQVHDQLAVPVAVCQAPESTWTSTLETAALSEAVPLMATEPETVAPADGVPKETDGTIVSAGG